MTTRRVRWQTAFLLGGWLVGFNGCLLTDEDSPGEESVPTRPNADADGQGGTAGAGSAGPDSVCSLVCSRASSSGCADAEPNPRQCAEQCTELRRGTCAAEFNRYLHCAEPVESMLCTDLGPVAEGCEELFYGYAICAG